MFRTKKDVERHVTDVLSKINSDNEKNLRGYTFARLFFQVKDYEAAKKYLSCFLSIREHHAPAHRLMAQIFEATNNVENALQSYKRSLELDSHQIDIVLKICELYCRLSVDHETARYWADRAEQLFPHNEIVFKLRECLVSAEGEPDHQELENLIANELAAQPRNVGLRIKLLRLYLDTERVKDAYEHATMIESKRLFPFSVDWYYLLGDIFEAYQEEYAQNIDSQFYIHYLTALDRLVLLTLAEPHSFSSENGKKQYNVNDAAATLLTFDQLLKKASERDIKEGHWMYFIHHMKGQLYFYMVSLLMKRSKMDQGNRKEAIRFSSGLAVVCYTFKPMNLLQEIWFSQLEDNQKAFTNFFQQGSLRTSFIGHVIMNICTEDRSKWLQKLKLEVCISQVKERIYSRIYSSVIQKDKLLSSYFILDSTFENCSLEFPSEVTLQKYDEVAFKLCSDSLHHLVWLALHKEATDASISDSLIEVFKGLQYSNKNLSKGSCESLCILDLEAYLYASVYQAQSVFEKKALLTHRSKESQLSYPPDIADATCSKIQASWWRAAYGLHSCTIKEKLGEYRRELQHGLEVIRGVGNHGMEVQLVVHLARVFGEKADRLSKEGGLSDTKKKLKCDRVTALQLRAIHYWNIAISMLDKIANGQSPKQPKEQMFSGFNKIPSKDEVRSLKEDGQLYIAVFYMDSDKLDEAAEILSKLSSAYGSYYLALTLKRLSIHEEFSNARAILLTKAKNSIHETMDRIKDDKSHPLNKEIYLVLEDLENELATEFSGNNSQDIEETDETDNYDATPEHGSSFYGTPRSTMHSTPRPSAQFISSKSRIQNANKTSAKHFEPSPERLDAQIRALALNQDTVVKTLLDQQKSFHETILEQQKSSLETNQFIAATLRQNTEVLQQLKKLMEDLKLPDVKNAHKTSNRKLSYSKGQGDEEDYNDYDQNGLLEFYAAEENAEDYRNSGYPYNQPSRMVHEAAASLNYVMSPAIPPGPPPAALNHYNYQYPPHAVLPAPSVAERPSYYHPPPGQGLPFSEGQQLPQFHFHVASPVVKPPPPIMSSVANLPQGVTLPPPPPPPINLHPSQPPPVSLHPPQPVIPPPNASLALPSPWSKTVTVPHAFQIPLPSAPFSATGSIASTSITSPITSNSELKNLLRTPPSQGILPFSQQLQTSVTTTSSSLSSVSIFAGISKTPELAKLERSRCDSDNAASPDIDGDLEKEVMGDFKPLIPLPAEIVVETGEENELALFEDRAKLYRFVDQEWKERGTGIVKMLHHNASGRVRLLMRRDQVLKVCANHYLTSNMEIRPLKSSDRAWTWVAQDFADEELRPEKFCIRFKTAEMAAAFKAAFNKAVHISKESELKNLTSPRISLSDSSLGIQKPFGAKFLPKAGSWTCPTCYVSNAADKLLCVACETNKPGVSIASTSVATVPSSIPSSISSFKTSNETQFTFGSATSFQSNNMFSKSTLATSPKSVFGGFTFSSSPLIRETESPDAKDREILVVSTKAKNGPQVSKVGSTSPFSGFSFVKSPVSTSTATVQSLGEPQSPGAKVGDVLVVSTKAKNGHQVSKIGTTASSPFSTFSFMKSPVSTSTVTVEVSGTSRNVTVSDKNSSSLFSNSKSLPSTTSVFLPASQSGTVSSSTSTESSLSKMHSMIQNITPAYTFDSKEPTKDRVGETNNSEPSTVNIRLSSDGSPEEFVPTAEFKPVVPLPSLVEVKTGEEGAEKLFDERAKIFRFDAESKEWKERGVGELKILYLKDSKKYRILMRRDQVLKICANHYIVPEMKLTPLAKSDKSWVWFAQDYSEGDLVQEQFAARFKNIEIAERFYQIFQKCQIELKLLASDKGFPQERVSSDKVVNECAGNRLAFDDLLKQNANSWECSNCHKSNMNFSSCIYCKTAKVDNSVSLSKSKDNEQTPLSELFKSDAGSWECHVCYVRNKSNETKCVACESVKPGSTQTSKDASSNEVKKTDSASSVSSNSESLANLFKPQPGSWECQSCLVRNSADKTQCISCETVKSGSSAASVPKPSNLMEKFSFGSTNTATAMFSFEKPKLGGEFVFGMKPATQPTTFSFGASSIPTSKSQTVGFKPSLPTSNAPAVFGGMTQIALSEKTNTPVSTNETPVFGSFPSPKFQFGTNVSSPEPVEFRFGSPQKYEFNFTGVRPRSPVKTPKSPRSPATPSDVDEEDEGDSDVDNIYFQPAIPLPPKVEVVTGEEDENVLYCKRAKLFRFSGGEWKERGLGEIKILFDDKANRVRLLMRREQVLKVCLNHYLTKEMKFETRGDKSWSWTATDFSENEPSPELLAVRFKMPESAKEFKEAIDNALKKMDEPELKNCAEATVAKPITLFSFKSDDPVKSGSNFNTGSLSSLFGTNPAEKSGFGNTAAGEFSFSGTNDSDKTFSPFSFKGKPETSLFFKQSTIETGETAFKKDAAFVSGLTAEKTDDDDVKIEYECSASADKIAAAEKLMLPKNFYLYEKCLPCPGCRGCSDTIPPHRGAVPDEPEQETVDVAPSSEETVLKPTDVTSEETVMFSNPKLDSFSFADLANKSDFQALSKSSPSNKQVFAGAGTPLFSTLNTSTYEKSDEVSQGPDIHFEPVIPLPDLIEVKTGEEDETPLFVHRAKLFRYDPITKQWKERGVGDIKILRHKENLRFRIILRRDQVHNVACNHSLTKEMALTPLATSDSALCWTAMDYSDGQGEPSQFAVRFKNKDLLNQFKKIFTDSQELLRNCKEDTPQDSDTSAALTSGSIRNDEGALSVKEADANYSTEQYNSQEESEEEDDYEIQFEKRASLEIYDEALAKFQPAGMGNMKIIYDDTVYGYRILMTDDKGVNLCDHIIAVQTCLRVEKKSGIWAALDLASESFTRRQFRATFSSAESLKEFNKCFEEGKEIALKSEIVEQN